VNPYAPPTEPQPPLAGAAFIGGAGPQPWTATGALGMAWDRYKEYAFIATIAFFVVLMIDETPAVGVQIGVLTKSIPARGSDYQIVNIPVRIIGFLIATFLECGAIAMALKMARGEQAGIGDIFSGGRFFGRMLVVRFLTMIAVVIGLVLLVVPGIIIGLGLMLAPYYIVDQDLDAIGAMKASWDATKGQKGDLFLLGLLNFLVILLGLCVLGVGVFVALPVAQLATTFAYLHIAGRIAPAAAPPPRAYDPYSGYAP
jgi:hypothetical protein